jgi:hypothetical protein
MNATGELRKARNRHEAGCKQAAVYVYASALISESQTLKGWGEHAETRLCLFCGFDHCWRVTCAHALTWHTVAERKNKGGNVLCRVVSKHVSAFVHPRAQVWVPMYRVIQEGNASNRALACTHASPQLAYLQKQRLVVCKHESEQRGDHAGLAGPHDHLLDYRLRPLLVKSPQNLRHDLDLHARIPVTFATYVKYPTLASFVPPRYIKQRHVLMRATTSCDVHLRAASYNLDTAPCMTKQHPAASQARTCLSRSMISH